MNEIEEEDESRVVLGQREDTFAGFRWTGAEPEGLSDPEEAEAMGAIWEDGELVTYDLPSLNRQYEHSGEGWLEDND